MSLNWWELGSIETAQLCFQPWGMSLPAFDTCLTIWTSPILRHRTSVKIKLNLWSLCHPVVSSAARGNFMFLPIEENIHQDSNPSQNLYDPHLNSNVSLKDLQIFSRKWRHRIIIFVYFDVIYQIYFTVFLIIMITIRVRRQRGSKDLSCHLWPWISLLWMTEVGANHHLKQLKLLHQNKPSITDKAQ